MKTTAELEINPAHRLPLNVGSYRERYLELLKRSLIDSLGLSTRVPEESNLRLVAQVEGQEPQELDLTDPRITYSIRLQGLDWPEYGATMVGYLRLDTLQRYLQTVLDEDVPGDAIEAGVWRGGTSLFMREVLGDDDRTVWAADSFRGFDPRDPQSEAFISDGHGEFLSVPLGHVEEVFNRYGVSTERVRFVEGYVQDTMPGLAAQQWSLIRIDCDTYHAVGCCLQHLYPKLSPGGFVIIDDYRCIQGCRAAVDEYREHCDISDELISDDWSSAYWRKGT